MISFVYPLFLNHEDDVQNRKSHLAPQQHRGTAAWPDLSGRTVSWPPRTFPTHHTEPSPLQSQPQPRQRGALTALARPVHQTELIAAKAALPTDCRPDAFALDRR